MKRDEMEMVDDWSLLRCFIAARLMFAFGHQIK